MHLGERQEFVVVVQRAVDVLDITGSQSDEVNTLTFNAQDVLDVTDPDNMFVVLDGVEVGTVHVDDDLTVQFETAMACSGRFAGEIFGMRTAGPWGRHWFFCLCSQPRRGMLRFSPARFVSPMRDSPVLIDATQLVPSPSR